MCVMSVFPESLPPVEVVTSVWFCFSFQLGRYQQSRSDTFFSPMFPLFYKQRCSSLADQQE